MLSAYFDDRDPMRQSETRRFWEALPPDTACVSDIVVAEVLRHPEAEPRAGMLGLAGELRDAPVTQAARALARRYGTVPGMPRSDRDLLHLAVATLAGCRTVVSWDLRHLANDRTRGLVAQLHERWGYPPVDLVTPAEALEALRR